MARVLGCLLAAWLAVNTWLLAVQGSARLREDRAIAAQESLGGKYARILGQPELGPALDEMLRLLSTLRERGDERCLLVAPPQFGLFQPIARQHAFPTQVLDELPGERGREALIAAARQDGARTVLWFRPAKGWTLLDTAESGQ